MFLLDTHILLWWLEGSQSLSAKQKKILKAASETHPLFVSDISLWEIATLHSLGRLHFSLPLRDWLERAVAKPLVQTLPITPAIASEVTALPDSFHRDPGDRVIVSTCRVHGLTLLTKNQRIIDAKIVPIIS